MSKLLEFARIKELVFELPIEQVMQRELITVSPKASIRDLKEILRLNRISGAPVLENGKLVGIISLEDLIKALEEGDLQGRVEGRMTRQLITVGEKGSVVEAIQKFSRHKVGRLLVVDETGGLRGILTRGDITQGLLKAVSRDFETEELSRYRARHIFEDIVSDQTSLILTYRVAPRDFKKGGGASSKLKRALDRLGAGPVSMRRVAIAAYEAEMNLVIHSDHGGEMTGEIRPDRVRLVVEDDGPGIADVTQAMSPGFSTAPNWIRDLGFGAGMGLANIKRCVDEMTLTSTPGIGTRLEMLIILNPAENTGDSGKEGAWT
ncbi:MAG: CBS domain-containing protein [Deltaproteobacteria bacterium]|nr:CBS domain-containing protein [Deltaproteobacteria bacterium]